jgi:hypothetical protein
MRIALILAGLMLTLAAESQEIYRWVDKDGVVHYADQPGAADAERVEIANSNEYQAQEYTPSVSSGQPAAQAVYTSLTITQPAADEVFFGGDAVVTAAADVVGELHSDHTLVFFVDGNRVPAEGGSSVELPRLERGTHFLRASVLDQNGAPLISSPQISFHVRMPSINTPQSPQAPKPPPKPKPKPAS